MVFRLYLFLFFYLRFHIVFLVQRYQRVKLLLKALCHAADHFLLRPVKKIFPSLYKLEYLWPVGAFPGSRQRETVQVLMPYPLKSFAGLQHLVRPSL